MRYLCGFTIWILFAIPALAQNTSGVFGPVVNADDHGVQYRAAFDFDDDSWSQRFHYQKALNGDLRLRGIIATRETASSEMDFDFIRAEAVWQVTPDSRNYQSGFRFEGRIRGNGRPDEVRANWINQWSLRNGWRARAILMNTLQVADKTNDELDFSGRFGLSRKTESGVRLGVHSFVDFGDTGGIQVFNGNTAEIGPFISFNVTDQIDLYVGTLHGLTRNAADNQFRVFVGRSF